MPVPKKSNRHSHKAPGKSEHIQKKVNLLLQIITELLKNRVDVYTGGHQ